MTVKYSYYSYMFNVTSRTVQSVSFPPMEEVEGTLRSFLRKMAAGLTAGLHLQLWKKRTKATCSAIQALKRADQKNCNPERVEETPSDSIIPGETYHA